MRLFGEVGYHGVTVEEVAQRARVTRGTIYRRWGSVADLLTAALTHDPFGAPGFRLPRSGPVHRLQALLAFAEREMGTPFGQQLVALSLDRGARAALPRLPLDDLIRPTVRDVERLLGVSRSTGVTPPDPRAVALRPALLGLVMARLAVPHSATTPLDALLNLLKDDQL